MKVAFIGGGTMGEAMIKAILQKSIASPSDVMVSDISAERRSHLSEHLGVSVTADNREAVRWGEVTVLAVKPQALPRALIGLEGVAKPQQLILSIVAGASLKALSSALKHHQVVRAMPNTPAQIGEGITVWTCTERVTEEQRRLAGSILAATGDEIAVDEERYIDMATALSGSGPAYVYLVMEALIDAGVYIGMPRATVERLVLRTLLGSARLAEETGRHPAELRNMVTSPGGTTAEALVVLEEARLRSVLMDAVVAAYEKARSLGG
ncbi:MAG: pyrroline-5-carboxylate reductase [Chloroflexi bacterium]|nr:pyrroline-5-carboxylate reductase [Chloroflexota bacterium]